MRIRFHLFSLGQAERLGRHFQGLGRFLTRFFSGMRFDLRTADLPVSAESYLAASFFSAFLYGLFFGVLFTGVFFLRDGKLLPDQGLLGALIGLGFFMVFFFLHTVYPRLISQQVAAGVDESLLFALRSMLIQVASGVSLYNAMTHISRAQYGRTSREFAGVVRAISTGTPETRALENLALTTKSDFLKKTCWQLVTAMRSGASVKGAIQSVVGTLTQRQFRAIKDYAAELNLWILFYLLMAAALPTMGITFMVILSSFSGGGVGVMHIQAAVGASFLTQILLIGFIKTRIPRVYI